MRKLLDIGINQIRKLLAEMGKEALIALDYAKESLTGKENNAEEISAKLKILRSEVFEIATELLVRYSPVASDLRFIQGALDTSYDLYRISRYAMEIGRTARIVGGCYTERIKKAFELSMEAVKISTEAFSTLNEVLVGRVLEIDEAVDKLYISSLEDLKKGYSNPAEALILRHLERICDHAKEIGVKVLYVKEGKRGY
ncbi:phosphate signaling complex PhoU family protein [Pyrococcus abyssi]|uniref:Phosphate ABC transporter, regulatory protein n=1 Tax=Pyrococcus abyssi (strain GE5 / Orsay) TaxID=272844 RepID=Q9UZU5_PYRAB|nr:phosphate uptake regulator PhoU [Pyrococcus abyssi]CAB49961.1 phoU phosphate ABC transporter, regulatory protein [Pyrococcus abyssi GE5]CCE70460.1 TPA: phosphate ABC transporter, regulatory protein [Pyrococcus abyssi GE5]